jgi:hypothetical protein
VAGNIVIPAKNDSGFPRMAAAQDRGRVGAHPRKIDCGMPGSGERAVVAVRFFEQERGLGVGP